MKVDMGHGLSRHLAVVLEEVPSLGPSDALEGLPQRRQMQRQCRVLLWLEVGKFATVRPRDDEQVPLRKRSNVHERKHVFVLKNDGRRYLPTDDLAEHAVRISRHVSPPLQDVHFATSAERIGQRKHDTKPCVVWT